MKVKLNVKYGKNMPNDIIELDKEKATYLIDNGFAVEVGNTSVVSKVCTNEDIIDSLDLTEDEKLYLLDNIGDNVLKYDKNNNLTIASKKVIDKILETI